MKFKTNKGKLDGTLEMLERAKVRAGSDSEYISWALSIPQSVIASNPVSLHT